MSAKSKKAVDYAAVVQQSRRTMERQVAGVGDTPTVEAQAPGAASASDGEKVGLNLRITKDRRAFIKSWCALHDVAMNDLISGVIDQIKAGAYDPLADPPTSAK